MPSPDQLAPYLKPLGSVFNFPLAEQMILSAQSEQAAPLNALLASTYAAFHKAAGSDFIDAPFLSNHDQERVFSRLDGNIDHMRVAAAMLLTLPGRPFLYYGEELGVLGRKPDQNLREPMRWERDPQVITESRWKPITSGQGGEVSVQAEQPDPHSLLNVYRTLIHWRSQEPLLRDGDIRVVSLQNAHVVAYERFIGERRVLVLHNLSGQSQSVKLKRKDGYQRVELQTGNDATYVDGELDLPPYVSVVMQ
jgi:glycosidase